MAMIHRWRDSGARNRRLDHGRSLGRGCLCVRCCCSRRLLLIAAAPPPKPKTPTEIVAAAPASAWRDIPADDLLVIDLRNGGRIVIQLAPAVRAGARRQHPGARRRAAGGTGRASTGSRTITSSSGAITKATKPLPEGRRRQAAGGISSRAQGPDRPAAGLCRRLCAGAGFAAGWPIGYDPKAGTANLTHCYGYVGVGRDLSPDTGTGGELYAVIGHAPRAPRPQHRDRRPGHRRHRAAELAAARDRSARLLQGSEPERADLIGAAGERNPGG